MPVEALDHVNLRSCRVEEMRRFYVEALGFEAISEERAGLPTYRIGNVGEAFVHLVPSAAATAAEQPQIEHFAFRATQLRQLMDRLDGAGIAYSLFRDEPNGVVRVNLRDPDNNRLHVDFAIAEHQTEMAPLKHLSR